jgi:hypothetical protein
MGQMSYPETSVNKYQSTRHSIQKLTLENEIDSLPQNVDK